MDKTDFILKAVAAAIYEEEGAFFVTVNADRLDLTLEGTQRLVMGGKATPDLNITDEGIYASLSINRAHHDIHIPWKLISAVEGTGKAFYCRREKPGEEESGSERSEKNKKGSPHLKIVK